MASLSNAELLEVTCTRGKLRVKFCADTFDEEHAQGLAGELFELARGHGVREVHLDLGDVQFLSSSLLGSLIVLDRKLTDEGGGLSLCNLNPPVYELFRLTRLTDILDVQEKPV